MDESYAYLWVTSRYKSMFYLWLMVFELDGVD